MAKVKGSPKSGGRPKGSPNKNTAELREIVRNKLGKEALEEMCERYLYHKDMLNDQSADRLLIEITSYCSPKLKAVEHSSIGGHALGAAVAFVPFEKLIEANAKSVSEANGKKE